MLAEQASCEAPHSETSCTFLSFVSKYINHQTVVVTMYSWGPRRASVQWWINLSPVHIKHSTFCPTPCIYVTDQEMLFAWPNRGRWDGWFMWHIQVTIEIHTEVW